MTARTTDVHGLLAAGERLYRDLHAHPELAFAEHRTAGVVAQRLRTIGFEVTTGVGRTGVVGRLSRGAGPTVLLRADLDALAVTEETGLPYASETVPERGPAGERSGVMHACGHDLHVAALVVACEVLARQRTGWSGTVLSVFQPAEETGQGAQAMLDDGLLDRFGVPDVVLGQHVSAMAPTGVLAHCPGPALAGQDTLAVTLFGRGGHAAAPESTVDPVVLAAAVVLRLQTVVSREVPAAAAAVLTVGSVHAGSGAAVVADQARLELSVRTFEPAVRQRVLAAIDRIVHAEAAASGVARSPEVVRTAHLPVTVNEPQATGRVMAAHRTAVGAQRVLVVPPSPASEDFGLLGQAARAPSVYWYVGAAAHLDFARAVAAGGPHLLPAAHSSRFAPDPAPTLRTAVAALVSAVHAWTASPPRAPDLG